MKYFVGIITVISLFSCTSREESEINGLWKLEDYYVNDTNLTSCIKGTLVSFVTKTSKCNMPYHWICGDEYKFDQKGEFKIYTRNDTLRLDLDNYLFNGEYNLFFSHVTTNDKLFQIATLKDKVKNQRVIRISRPFY